jgi:hypothetical protein
MIAREKTATMNLKVIRLHWIVHHSAVDTHVVGFVHRIWNS